MIHINKHNALHNKYKYYLMNKNANLCANINEIEKRLFSKYHKYERSEE
jgi:hypothetical protein